VSDYFGTKGVGRADGAVGTFASVEEQPEVEAASGVRIRAVAAGGLMLSYVRIDPNSKAEVHTHDEEQMGLVLSGECTFSLDGEERPFRKGDVYHAPAGVPHGAWTGAQACEILDVFSPPRAALLELIQKAKS
jgi:unsaturated pyranuronate lyase